MTQVDSALSENAPAPSARPYGPVGLLISVIVILVLMITLSGILFGALAVADVALNGREHLRAAIEAGGAALASADKATVMYTALALGCLVYVAGIIVIFIVALWRGRWQWRGLLAWRGFSLDRAWALATGAIVLYGLLAGLILVKLLPEAKGWFVMPRGAGGLALTVLLAVVLAPIIEELLFRGWIYTALRARYSYVFVLLFTAGTFAVAHFERTGIYALVVFPVGLVLGWMRERTGSVFSTMAMHAIYNGSAVLTKLLLPD